MSKSVDPRQQALVAPFAADTMARQVEVQLERKVRFRDLPALLSRAMTPMHQMVARVGNEVTKTDLSVLSIAELLVEKGVFTKEEFEAKEAEVTKGFVEQMKKSPAHEQAQAAAGEKKVERLVEPVGEAAPEEESVSRSRLVEG